MIVILCFQVMNKHRYSHTMYELLLSRLIHVSHTLSIYKNESNIKFDYQKLFGYEDLKGSWELTHFLSILAATRLVGVTASHRGS